MYKNILIVFLALLFVLLISPQIPAYAASDCTQYTVPVTISSIDPTQYHVVGFLCNADKYNNVQLLLSGATYNHIYWDFPLNAKTYSYVQNTRGTDFATFNIDRIGTGQSDHPLSSSITIQSNAFIAHQIIQDLRAGSIGTKAFSKVVLVGHSMGSAMAINEAATYQDVDGVILTGYIHGSFNPLSVPTAINDSYPAFLDPAFSGLGLDAGYLTTVPGTRQQLFYYMSTADPAVIAEDEATKDTVTGATLGTFFPTFTSHESNAIHVPVLLVMGQFDFLNCDPTLGCTQDQVSANEASFFEPSATLEIHVIPNTGHDLNLHTTAAKWYKIATMWLKTHFDN